MSDDVRQAAFIGSAINKGMGAIPTLNKKRKKTNEDKKGKSSKETKTATTEQPTQEKPKQKVLEGEIVSPNEPTFVKSERVNKPSETKAITTGQKSISFDPYTLPTYGPGSEHNPNRGRQFNG